MLGLIISLAINFAFLPVLAPAIALADTNSQIFQACQNNQDTTVCQDQKNATTDNPINQYIHIASDIVASLTGLAAIIMIIVSGFKFVTGGGSPEGVKSARSTLIGATIGLVVIGLAWTIINYAVDKLIT